MKKALVVKQAYEGRNVGDIERVGEASEIDGYTHWRLENHWAKVEIPAFFTYTNLIKATQAGVDSWQLSPGDAVVTTEPTFAVDTWIKAGEADVTTDPSDGTYTAYLATDPDPRYTKFSAGDFYIETDVPKDKTKRIGAEATTLSTGVYTDLETTFGTKKPESATAWYLTALAMKDDPAFFSASGLEAEVATTTFAIGAALDTTQKVTDYSTELLADAKQYGLDRMLKYKTYRVNKTAIDNE